MTPFRSPAVIGGVCSLPPKPGTSCWPVLISQLGQEEQQPQPSLHAVVLQLLELPCGLHFIPGRMTVTIRVFYPGIKERKVDG